MHTPIQIHSRYSTLRNRAASEKHHSSTNQANNVTTNGNKTAEKKRQPKTNLKKHIESGII